MAQGSIYQTPRGGLAHPVFEGAGPTDQLGATFAFWPALDDAQLVEAQQVLNHWSERAERVEPDEPVHCDEPFLSPRALRVRVHTLAHPREAVSALLASLGQAVPVREAHFARYLFTDDGQEPAVIRDPTAPPALTHFPRHENYLAAVFDPASPPPASEYESQVRGALETRSGDIVLEDRGPPLHLPPLRIGYGTARAAFTPPDARAHHLAQALAGALARTFGRLAGAAPPPFSDHLGTPGAVDRVSVADRVGYGFAFASPQLAQRLTQTRFRYREPELFDALGALVAQEGLAPIVTWQRFGKPFAKDRTVVAMHVFQLWEPEAPAR